MKEDPTTEDLLEEGTQAKLSPAAVMKTVVGSVLAALPQVMRRLWRRLRS